MLVRIRPHLPRRHAYHSDFLPSQPKNLIGRLHLLHPCSVVVLQWALEPGKYRKKDLTFVLLLHRQQVFQFTVICNVMGRTGMGIAIGTGVCWEYMFIGTGMKTGTGTGTINTFTFSSPAEQLPEGRDRAGGRWEQ